MKHLSLFIAFFMLFACDDGKKNTKQNNNTNNVNNTNNTNNTTGCQTPGGEGPVFDAPRGRFSLEILGTAMVLQGRVWSADVPDPFTETRREGFCRLLESGPAFCDPPCAWGEEICVAGACRAYPQRIDAGRLTLSGALAAPVNLSADAMHEYYWYEDRAPVSARLQLSSDAADLAFQLETCVPQALTPTADWSARLAARNPGQDVTLSWSSPQAGARIYLRMTTGVATHGGVAHAEIECEGPDTGQLTLPGAFLDKLYETGWACGECGDNTLYRYFADETTIENTRLQWRIATSTHFYHIPGRQYK